MVAQELCTRQADRVEESFRTANEYLIGQFMWDETQFTVAYGRPKYSGQAVGVKAVVAQRQMLHWRKQDTGEEGALPVHCDLRTCVEKCRDLVFNAWTTRVWSRRLGRRASIACPYRAHRRQRWVQHQADALHY